MTLNAQTLCTVCMQPALSSVLALGEQPACNRFVAPSADGQPEKKYPVSVGYCQQCGTVQLVDRMPIEALRPIYDWVAYTEPEGHLDDLVQVLAGLPDITPAARVLGVTYKDVSTVDRLARRGFARSASIDPNQFNVPERPFGAETIQAILSSPDRVDQLRDVYGEAELLIARHIVEHANSANHFVSALRRLLSPGGYLVLELPDSERILREGNHAFIWEEHISYFTEDSLRQLAAQTAAELVWLGRYPYPYEDSLVAVFRFGNTPLESKATADIAGVSDRLRAFAAGMESSRNRWRNELAEYRRAGQRIAIFGAGHLAAKFINFIGLADMIDCVIDDHPRKIGLRMPGSHLPISGSDELRNIGVCVSTLSPESETKVRAKLATYFERGGRFIRAFVSSTDN